MRSHLLGVLYLVTVVTLSSVQSTSLEDFYDGISNSMNTFGHGHSHRHIDEEYGDSDESESWGYGPFNGPPTWWKSFPTCIGDEQSPIDITDYDIYARPLPRLKMRNYRASPSTWTLANDGRTVTLTGQWSQRYHPEIINGPFRGRFIFHQAHFHWGSRKGPGSEHAINGKKFPLEAHFVHYNEKYSSFEAAQGKPDGIVVIGILFKLRHTDNEAYIPVLKALSHITEPERRTTSVEPLFLGLLLPSNKQTYYTYRGSLTTPPCSHGVTWIIFQHHGTLSYDQMQSFHNLYTNSDEYYGERRLLENNYRPLQPLNRRKILVTLIREYE